VRPGARVITLSAVPRSTFVRGAEAAARILEEFQLVRSLQGVPRACMGSRPRIVIASPQPGECEALSDWLAADGFEPVR
jgi:hypothetical protein